MPKKSRSRRREGEEDASEPQPCCIYGCERYGTRLLTSLRATYQLKEEHSGRVCEGHYRRDLRRFKKHSEVVRSSSRRGEDDMMALDEDHGNKSDQSSRSASPVNMQAAPHSTKIEPTLHSAFTLIHPQQQQKIACSSAAVDSSPTSEGPWDMQQVNRFKLFCDIVLRNEGVTN